MLVLTVAFNGFAVHAQHDSLAVAVYALPRYSRSEMRVHRFLWERWQQRRTATAELTIFAMDTGSIYTVRIRTRSNGRSIITEHVRHYSGPPDAKPEPTILVATGVALRQFRLRNGKFAVRLVTKRGALLPLFE